MFNNISQIQNSSFNPNQSPFGNQPIICSYIPVTFTNILFNSGNSERVIQNVLKYGNTFTND